MNKIFTFLFLSLISLSSLAEIKLSSTYIRNKKVWGTYKQIKEVSNKDKKGHHHFQTGDAIISKKGLVFIKSSENETESKILVATLPYKKTSARTYQVDIKGKEKEIKNLYSATLKNLKLDIDYIVVNSLNCKTYNSGKLNCELSLQSIPAVAALKE